MIAWAALLLALLELALLAGVVVVVRRFWRQAAPQVQPLLAMFSTPQTSDRFRCHECEHSIDSHYGEGCHVLGVRDGRRCSCRLLFDEAGAVVLRP